MATNAAFYIEFQNMVSSFYELRKLANHALSLSGLSGTFPVDVHSVAKSYGISLIYTDLNPYRDELIGLRVSSLDLKNMTIFLDKSPCISDNQLRFNIALELGHYISNSAEHGQRFHAEMASLFFAYFLMLPRNEVDNFVETYREQYSMKKVEQEKIMLELSCKARIPFLSAVSGYELTHMID